MGMPNPLKGVQELFPLMERMVVALESIAENLDYATSQYQQKEGYNPHD